MDGLPTQLQPNFYLARTRTGWQRESTCLGYMVADRRTCDSVRKYDDK